MTILPLILLGLTCSGSPVSDITEPKCCGRHALSLVASFLGVEQPSVSWVHLLHDDDAPFSLDQLQEAALKAGLETLLVEWADPSSADLQCPCVLYARVSEESSEVNHFVACFGQKGDYVCLADYPRRPTMVPVEKLRRVWTGAVLYIGPSDSIEIRRLRWQLRSGAASR
jgi:ABC-type bacteriocin/lantibiotic exporter with double-glycine peptidase domain